MLDSEISRLCYLNASSFKAGTLPTIEAFTSHSPWQRKFVQLGPFEPLER